MTKRQAEAILWGIFSIPVAWLAMIIAKCYERGVPLLDFLTKLEESGKTPLRVHITHNTGPFLLIFLGIYGVSWLVHYLNKRTMREGEEQGSASWGNVVITNKKLQQSPPEANIILTKRLRIGLDTASKWNMNRNVLVIGGSGSGKTRYYVLPNILQHNSSYIITDPKGEALASTGALLKEEGYELLKRQREREARDTALELELYVTGTQDIFAHQSNVNMDNRLICFDINELGESFKTIGLLVVLDAIMTRIARNRNDHRQTYIFVDEVHVLLANQYSAEFLIGLWKRVRKYGAFATGVTQNISDVLDTAGEKILSNSAYVILHNQAPADRDRIAKLFNMSPSEEAYISNALPGRGIVIAGPRMVPFENIILHSDPMFPYLTTKPGETIVESAEIHTVKT